MVRLERCGITAGPCAGSGHSIEQYAITYSISVATARTQLRSILKKTGVSRQQELVRLLASLPTV